MMPPIPEEPEAVANPIAVDDLEAQLDRRPERPPPEPPRPQGLREATAFAYRGAYRLKLVGWLISAVVALSLDYDSLPECAISYGDWAIAIALLYGILLIIEMGRFCSWCCESSELGPTLVMSGVGVAILACLVYEKTIYADSDECPEIRDTYLYSWFRLFYVWHFIWAAVMVIGGVGQCFC